MQDEIALRRLLHLTIGSKIEHDETAGLEWEPTARLAYTPDDRRTAWCAISRAVRTPTENDLQAYYPAALFPVPGGGGLVGEELLVGNPNINSEPVVTEELGYRDQLSERWTLDATAFYNSYTQMESFAQGASYMVTTPFPLMVFPETYVNDGSGHTYGFEVVNRFRLTEQWRCDLSYSYLDGNVPTSLYLPVAAPKNQYQIHSYVNLPHNMEFDTAFYYVGKDLEMGSSGSTLALGSGALEYTKLDVRLGWRATKKFEVSVGAANLFSGAYQQGLNTFGVRRVSRSRVLRQAHLAPVEHESKRPQSCPALRALT